MHTPRALMGLLVVAAILMLPACGGTPEAPTVAATSTLPVPTATSGQSAAPTDTASSASGAWQKFTSNDGGFSVLFPGNPTEGSNTITTDVGDVAVHTFAFADPGGVSYTVSYNDYPADKVQNNGQQLLSGAVSGIAKSNNLLGQQSTTQQGHPAVLADFDAAGTSHLFYKGVVVQARLYQIIAVTPASEAESSKPDVTKFLDSFQITNP